MIDTIAHETQNALTTLGEPVILGSGIAFTFGGLTIWLAGLGMGRIAIIAVGAFAGSVAAYLIKSHPPSIILLGALVGAVLGLLIEILLAALLGYATTKYNLTISVLSASGGAVFILLGIILLLHLKGISAVDYIVKRQKLFLAALLVMMVFGILEQMILCKKPRNAIIKSEKTSPKPETEPQEKNNWRKE